MTGPSPRPRLFGSDDHLPFHLPAAGATGALLIHGFAGTPAEMRPLGRALAEAGVAASGPLLPGFGPDIDRLGETSAADWVAAADDAWAAMHSRYRRTVLVGFSMGGAVALQLATRRPPDRLVLLAPLWHLLGPAWPAGALLPLAGALLPALSPFRADSFDNPTVRRFFARAAADLDIDDPDVRRAVVRHARVPTRALASLWRLGLSSGALARQIQTPTLVIQGIDDRAVHPRDTRTLVKRFPGPIRLEEVAAGHQLVDDEGDAWQSVRDLVLGFAIGPSGTLPAAPESGARGSAALF